MLLLSIYCYKCKVYIDIYFHNNWALGPFHLLLPLDSLDLYLDFLLFLELFIEDFYGLFNGLFSKFAEDLSSAERPRVYSLMLSSAHLPVSLFEGDCFFELECLAGVSLVSLPPCSPSSSAAAFL